MAMDAASRNRAACRSWYERLKKDPVKHNARIAQISENRRKRRAMASHGPDRLLKQAATDSHSTGPCMGHLHSPRTVFEARPCESGRFEAPEHPHLLPSCEPQMERAIGALEEFLMDADVESLDEELGYGERAAIMEFDGGVTRAAAELAAVCSSTWATRPAPRPRRPAGLKATPSNGKHAATVAQGNVGLTGNQIIKTWCRHWGINSQTE
jgi:hypothetical protein